LTEEEKKGSKIEQPSTSTNTIELWRAREALFRNLERVKDEDTISPRLCRRIEQYLHGLSVQPDLKDQLEKDLQATEAAQAAQKARNTVSQRQVQGGGLC
jgi:hypothetical protein